MSFFDYKTYRSLKELDKVGDAFNQLITNVSQERRERIGTQYILVTNSQVNNSNTCQDISGKRTKRVS